MKVRIRSWKQNGVKENTRAAFGEALRLHSRGSTTGPETRCAQATGPEMTKKWDPPTRLYNQWKGGLERINHLAMRRRQGNESCFHHIYGLSEKVSPEHMHRVYTRTTWGIKELPRWETALVAPLWPNKSKSRSSREESIHSPGLVELPQVSLKLHQQNKKPVTMAYTPAGARDINI